MTHRRRSPKLTRLAALPSQCCSRSGAAHAALRCRDQMGWMKDHCLVQHHRPWTANARRERRLTSSESHGVQRAGVKQCYQGATASGYQESNFTKPHIHCKERQSAQPLSWLAAPCNKIAGSEGRTSRVPSSADSSSAAMRGFQTGTSSSRVSLLSSLRFSACGSPDKDPENSPRASQSIDERRCGAVLGNVRCADRHACPQAASLGSWLGTSQHRCAEGGMGAPKSAANAQRPRRRPNTNGTIS